MGRQGMHAGQANWGARFLAAVVLAGGLCANAHGQFTINEREIQSTPLVGDTFTLDFRFKDPRILKLYEPGKGTRIYYYLWYQVVNRTGKPQRFVPRFELVTVDYPGNYIDRVNPFVQEAVKKIEDPSGYQDIKNSVEISLEMIPPSKDPDVAFPIRVTGVAIWEITQTEPAKRDPKSKDKDIADSGRFSIYVTGLSNAHVTVDNFVPGEPPITRHKTLQLN